MMLRDYEQKCIGSSRGDKHPLVCGFCYYGQSAFLSFHSGTHIYKRCPFKENKKIKFQITLNVTT